MVRVFDCREFRLEELHISQRQYSDFVEVAMVLPSETSSAPQEEQVWIIMFAVSASSHALPRFSVFHRASFFSAARAACSCFSGSKLYVAEIHFVPT